MKGEYISIETARIMADIEKENKKLQEENEKIRFEMNNYEAYSHELENKIDKAIEYMTSYESIATIQQLDNIEENKSLDEKTIVEMTRRYLIVHDKLLNILQD